MINILKNIINTDINKKNDASQSKPSNTQNAKPSSFFSTDTKTFFVPHIKDIVCTFFFSSFSKNTKEEDVVELDALKKEVSLKFITDSQESYNQKIDALLHPGKDYCKSLEYFFKEENKGFFYCQTSKNTFVLDHSFIEFIKFRIESLRVRGKEVSLFEAKLKNLEKKIEIYEK